MKPVANGVELWLAVEQATPGRTVQQALDDLNQACGRRYTYSHLSRWRRGLEQPNLDVVRYMARIAGRQSVHEVLGITVTVDEIETLLDYLLPPAIAAATTELPVLEPQEPDDPDEPDDLGDVMIGRFPDFDAPPDS